MKEKKVLVGVVVYNEEGRIEKVIKRIHLLLSKHPYHFVFVDDCSTDSSYFLLKKFSSENKRITLIRNKKNSGVGSSIKKIIEFGVKNKFIICSIIAGNGKDNPSQIPMLIKPLLENHYDYVQGSRFLKGGSYKNLPFARRYMINGFTFLVGLFTGFRGTDASNGFRAYKLSIFNDKRINIRQQWLNRYEFETYLHYKVISLGYKITEVAVTKDYLVNVKNYSKIRPFYDWWRMLRPLIILRLGIKQ